MLLNEASLQAGIHLLKNSLTSDNEDLEVLALDMCEDINISPIADPEVRDLVFNPSMSGVGNPDSSSERKRSVGAEGAEEAKCLGTSMIHSTALCIGSFIESPQFRQDVKVRIPSLLQESIELLNKATSSFPLDESKIAAVSLDILYLIKILPVCGTPDEIMPKLTLILKYLIEGGYYRGGRAVVALVVQLLHLLGGIFSSCRKGGANESQFSVISEVQNSIFPILNSHVLLVTGLNSSLGAIEYSEEVQIASAAAFLQVQIILSSISLPNDDFLSVYILQLIVGLPLSCLSTVIPAGSALGACLPVDTDIVLGEYLLRNMQHMMGSVSSIPVEVDWRRKIIIFLLISVR